MGQTPQDRFAGDVPYLKATAHVLGGHYHLAAAMAELDTARVGLARFYIERLLPEHAALLTQVRVGADGLYALTPDDLVV